MDDDRAGGTMDTVDAFLRGQTHLFCALADALERSGGPTKKELAAAVRAKIDWLAGANVVLEEATPLLVAEEWLTDPPRDPRDPWKERDQRLKLVKPDR